MNRARQVGVVNPNLEVLQAIVNVQNELKQAVLSGQGNISITEIKDRLMVLYGTLNITNIIVAIEKINYKK